MKKFDLQGECDFRDLSPAEIETACVYEYMRESKTLGDALNCPTDAERKKKSRELPPFFLWMTDNQFFSLIVALQKAGFPKPWKCLSKASQRRLVSFLAKSTRGMERGDKERFPPVMIEEGAAEFDPFENYWRVGQLEPSELSLLKGWQRTGRRYFWGFIRIDRGYNETEAVEAFKREFRKRWPKTKGGNRERWGARLKNLAAMRIWKHHRNQCERLKAVAKFCRYEGCVKEAAAYEERRKQGHGDEPMSDAAKAEISRAQADARAFFQTLFPGEEPLSYRASGDQKS